MDIIFRKEEKTTKPDKVFTTNTHSNILKAISPDVNVVIDGDVGIETLKRMANESWDRNRDLEIQCNKIIFKRSAQ